MKSENVITIVDSIVNNINNCGLSKCKEITEGIFNVDKIDYLLRSFFYFHSR